MSEYKLYLGNCLDHLEFMPDNSVNCCVTSPPYFGLRAYMPDAVRLRDDLSAGDRKSIEEELERLGVKPNFG